MKQAAGRWEMENTHIYEWTAALAFLNHLSVHSLIGTKSPNVCGSEFSFLLEFWRGCSFESR